MTDHAWAADRIAAFVAGGLDAAEAERLSAHARDCPDCTTALADARGLDGGLTALFAGVRPGPALEDGVIRALRTGSARRSFRFGGWPRKLVVGAAATIGVGAVGIAASRLAELGELPLPGVDSVSRVSREGSKSDEIGRDHVRAPMKAYDIDTSSLMERARPPLRPGDGNGRWGVGDFVASPAEFSPG